MQLLTPDVGWVLGGGRLYWTMDNGTQWTNVTPPLSQPKERITDVYFRNPYEGWVLLSAEADNTEQWRFEVAATLNSGATWSVTAVDVPGLNPEVVLTGEGSVDFVDSAHGWLSLGVATGSNFSVAVMIATQDGGATWSREEFGKWTRRDYAMRGRVHFVSPNDGWVAGGPGGGFLYVTHDGGKTWLEVTLKAPPEAGLANQPLYSTPIFNGTKQGYLPVTYMAPEGSPWALALFATHDGGQTWQADGVMRLGEDYVPSAVVDSTLLAAKLNRQELTLWRLTAGGAPASTTAPVPRLRGVAEVNFATSTQGWLFGGTVLATTDGGASWTDISPWRHKERSVVPQEQHSASGVSQEGAGLPLSSSTAAAGSSPTHTSIHMGFDKCYADTQSHMQTWWTYSPYYDTSGYLGGVSRACPQSNLSKSWVAKVTGQGWGLIPLWVGPQAPCSVQQFSNQFSSTPSVAATQAVTEADSAASAANSLGLGQTIVYYDLENYTASQCGPAADAFVSGWVNELHKKGYLAGVYGNPGDAGDWWSVQYVPDYVWVGRYDSRATIWGLAHDLPSSGDLINDTMWTDNQRGHQ